MNKVQLIFCVFFIALGISFGHFLWHKWHYCAEIHAPHALFYGPFAQKLKFELLKLGYSFSCPDFLPRTNLQFVHTRKDYDPIPIPPPDSNRTNIAIVGDCFNDFDLQAFDAYQLVLPINEYHHGYLSQFNYKTAFFAIHNCLEKNLCQTDFFDSDIDVRSFAVWPHSIIQGLKNDEI